jgi:hypothetical protein
VDRLAVRAVRQMDVPQSPQNLNRGGLANPHVGHGAVTGVPHSPQNFSPSGLSKPQLGQCMGAPSGTAVRVVGGIGAEARRPSQIDMGWMVC